MLHLFPVAPVISSVIAHNEKLVLEAPTFRKPLKYDLKVFKLSGGGFSDLKIYRNSVMEALFGCDHMTCENGQ